MKIIIDDYVNKTYNQWTIIAYDKQKSKENIVHILYVNVLVKQEKVQLYQV